MNINHFFIGALFAIFLVEIFKNSKQSQQINKMQGQINELYRLVEHDELVSTYISEEDEEFIKHLKNTGKEIEAVKKVREVTAMDLAQAKQYVDRL